MVDSFPKATPICPGPNKRGKSVRSTLPFCGADFPPVCNPNLIFGLEAARPTLTRELESSYLSSPLSPRVLPSLHECCFGGCPGQSKKCIVF